MVWTDPPGTRREKVLPGKFDSPESLEAFARLQLEPAVRPTPKSTAADSGPGAAEVLLPYLRHAREYRGEGSEPEAIKPSPKVVRTLYGAAPAAAFGPLALEAVREAMVEKGWRRRYVDRQARKVVAAVKWCVSGELIPRCSRRR